MGKWEGGRLNLAPTSTLPPAISARQVEAEMVGRVAFGFCEAFTKYVITVQFRDRIKTSVTGSLSTPINQRLTHIHAMQSSRRVTGHALPKAAWRCASSSSRAMYSFFSG